MPGTPGGRGWELNSGRRGERSERGRDETEGRLGGEGDEAYRHNLRKEDEKRTRERERVERGGVERGDGVDPKGSAAADEEDGK
jgi:hypothetical protein